MFNLLEDIKNVNNIIKYVDSIVVKLRTSGKLDDNPKLYSFIKSFYDNIITDFYEYCLLNDDIDPKREEAIIDGILIFIGKIKNL